MKKRAYIIGLVVITSLMLCSYITYEVYFPKYIVSLLIDDKNPTYLPKIITNKIDKIKEPINKNSEALILAFEKSGIKTEELLYEVDRINEVQFDNFISELNNLKNKSDASKIFDLGKQYFPVSFDVEALRDEFLKHATPQTISKAMYLVELYQKEQVISFESGKQIIKQLILQKQAELKAKNLTQ